MVEIDGSLGEGGGQILRSSLTLSLLTGKTLRLHNIRARRSEPGLKAQHLKAVQAAAAVGKAQVEGAELGSTELLFEPGPLTAGTYQFDIGTAGSTSLVLQTILLPLSYARQASRFTVSGGTHVPWSPSFHYLDLHWRHFLARIGFRLSFTLEAAGFYPRGGGRVTAAVEPSGQDLRPLRLTKRGAFRRFWGISAVANLSPSIAERQKRQALNCLERIQIQRHTETLRGTGRQISTPDIEIRRLPSAVKGTTLFLVAEFERTQAAFSALGSPGKPAEQVADEAVGELEEFLRTEATVDRYLADQLVVPLALLPGESLVKTAKITRHLLTNVEVTRQFLPVELELQGEEGGPGRLRIRGAKEGWMALTGGL